MSSVVACDASALIALLLDSGEDGEWVAASVAGAEMAAPALIDWETANIIRRHERSRLISTDQAAQAYVDLMDLAVERWPYEAIAPRVWELRANLSVYDASYVAVAESRGGPLVTLDRRIARAPGVRCPVLTR